MTRFTKIIGYAFRQWPLLLVILACTAGYTASSALEPWPMKLLVDHALGDGRMPAALEQFVEGVGLRPTPTVLVALAALASITLFVINSLLGVAMGLSWSMSGQRMVYALAGDLFGRLQRLSLLFHGRRNTGDSLSRLTDDTWCLYAVADGLLMAPFQQLCTLLVTGWIAFLLDPLLAVVGLTMAPLLAGSSLVFGRHLKRRAKLGREAHSRLLSFVHQTLGATPIVQVFGSERRNSQRFAALAQDATRLTQRGNLVGSLYGLVNGLIATCGVATILVVGGSRVLAGVIPLGTLLVFVVYVRQLQSASGGLFSILAQLKAAEASLDRLLEVLESEEVVQESADARSLPEPARGGAAAIRLENVTFGYEPGRAVLHDVTLEARAGEVVALVGPTGAGKSTLVSLIPRFFDPWQGQITIDGTDIRQATLASVRQRIAIVLQEPFLLPLTIADNIAYGRPDAAREEVVAAAVAARADEFIRQLPQGYDTIVGERGATISGGEAQRLAIARALLKDAPVLILDEPTSALDVRTEAELLEALQRLMAGRTTLVIAHRLSTIRNAHQIAVLDQGRLVEWGTHEQLLESEGVYHRLYAGQFGPLPQKVPA